MDEEQAQEMEPRTTEEAWRDVGRQFEALGKSLADAFRTVWEGKETQEHVHGMQEGLESLVQQVDEAIKEAARSPEAEKVRGEADKAAESLRQAGEKTWEDARPHVVSALSSVNEELQRMIDRLQQEEAAAEASSAKEDKGEPTAK